MQFNDLKLKSNIHSTSIQCGDKEFIVYDYIGSAKEDEMVDDIIRYADGGTIYINPTLLNFWFEMYYIKYFTNIKFTDAEWEHSAMLYDLLYTNGIIDKVLNAYPDTYVRLWRATQAAAEEKMKYRASVSGMMESFGNGLMNFITEASAALKDFDLDKYENVAELARSLNLVTPTNEQQ